jgi:hypothetical protein
LELERDPWLDVIQEATPVGNPFSIQQSAQFEKDASKPWPAWSLWQGRHDIFLLLLQTSIIAR